MSAFKEIVTKAVIGKGKIFYKNSYVIETEHVPSTVLGCWVINHTFKGSEIGGKIVVDGSFDVNLWYSYDNDTKTTVITKKITYSESVMVRQREASDSTVRDIVVRSLKQPNCIHAKENEKSIVIEIEKELGIEIVGDTKVKVAVSDDEDPWDVIEDTESMAKVSDEIDKEVEANYLNSSTEKESFNQK